MATLPSLLSQYEILETLTTHIWASDLEALAFTCREMHTYIRGSAKVHAHLRKATLACNGVSGRAWKEEWLADPGRMFETRGRVLVERLRVSYQSSWRWFASDQEKKAVMRRCREVLLDEMKCTGETEGAEGSRPCVVCQEPVCENCRFRSAIYAVTTTPRGTTISPSFAGDYKQKLAARWDEFCRACVDFTIKARPDGKKEKLPKCSCSVLEEGEPWMCAPCYGKQRAARLSVAPTWCEELVPTTKGCFGLKRCLLKCRWCLGY
ncbi:hypothetical protein BDY17DRAFT_321594 [Neohortaea acidophila]|uniref:Uncharacterized protein n=1 Tax=Neohortaea acidophila TaxID=245834 RepID=A0A6A6Q5B9_9PEZI|nr:uncharacterized protein BDY17DRAFT_321594 [Neohortaea acidophila]KAF2486833.1 hypothetical protein BDY17DRAFT_321594 [Neohortaea acidophila]